MNGFCECGCGEIPKQSKSRFAVGHHRRKSKAEFVIEDRGFETPCHIWQRSMDIRGYGLVPGSRTTRLAHRIIYEREVGAIPKGLTLDHLCRVRCCVNPSHLEPVTLATNSRRGSKVKLNPEKAKAIRERYASGNIKQIDLAREYGIVQTGISKIVNGETWPVGEKI